MKDETKSSNRLLIQNGEVVNDDSMCLADVYIEDGLIKEVGENLQVPAGTRIIDAKGKFVMPGGIDPHTHMRAPLFGTVSVDDFYTGTRAALAGGTTMIIDFVTPAKTESLIAAYEKYRYWADPNVCCDYGFSVIINHMSEKIKDEMGELVKHKGINSFKFFMAYKDALQISDGELYQGLLQCKKYGALARVHAENGDVIALKQQELLCQGVTGPEGHLQSRPEEVEAEATNRACMIAGQANCPLYVVHVMSKGAAEAIGNARRRGTVVFGEAVGSALSGVNGAQVFDRCWRHAAAHVMSPPLRTDSTTPGYLLDMLTAGQLHLTGSDHAVFTSQQKLAGKDDFSKIPNGVNGVEERMMILWERGVNAGKMDPMRFVSISSSMAAKLFNVYPRKGRIAPGSDADIVIWDPECHTIISSTTHHSKCDFNIFDGFACTGAPWVTISRGHVVYEDGQLKVSQGAGKFVQLPPFSPHVFSSVLRREKVRVPIKIDRTSNGSVSTASSLQSPPQTNSTGTPATSPMTQNNLFDDMPVGAGKFSQMHISQDFHARPATRAGGRNLQDSTFNLSGTQIDDEQGQRRSTKISKPPGGESRGLW